MKQVDPLLFTLNIITVPIFFTNVVFYILFIVPNTTGLYLTSADELLQNFYTEISPTPFIFFVLVVIYVWQFLWIVYSLTLVCRQGEDGPLSQNPVLLSSAFFGFFILSQVLNIFWQLLVDRELFELALVFLIGMAASLTTSLALSYKALYTNRFILAGQKRRTDDVLIRVLVQNGLALYAAWIAIAVFLTMAVVIAYRSNPPIDQSTATTASLAILSVLFIIFIVTDLTVFNKFSRYTATPYTVFILVTIGTLVITVDNGNFGTNFVYTAVFVSAVLFALVFRIALTAVNSKSDPIFPILDATNSEEIIPASSEVE